MPHNEASAGPLVPAHHAEPAKRVGERIHHVGERVVAAEKLAENIEGVPEGKRRETKGKLFVKLVVTLAPVSARGTTTVRRQTLLSIFVVNFALFFVTQHLVSFRYLFESPCCFLWILWIFVGVPFERELPVRFLDF